MDDDRPTPPTPFTDALIERINRLLEAVSLSHWALSNDMGKTHNWSLRKTLRVDPHFSRGRFRVTENPLEAADVDLILNHLGVPLAAITDPAWLDTEEAAAWATAWHARREKARQDSNVPA